VSESTVYLAGVRALPRDWSKRELVHLHRAISVLWNAGLSLETDRGVTDEGEPWFVFCDTDTDAVVAHFARIRGTYILGAPFLNGALTGRVFPDLVKYFLEHYPGRRVASFNSDSTPAGRERRRQRPA
jgi:hypothetical protein